LIVHIETPNARCEDGQVSSGRGTRITTDGGAEIHEVMDVVVRINACKIITAEMQLMVSLKATATASFWMIHPISGQRQQIKRIEFADGSIFE
jgi:hypothetical protein